MRDYEHYALDPIGPYRRHPVNAVWGEDGHDRFLRSFPGDYADLVEGRIKEDPYLSTPLPDELEGALDDFVEHFRAGKSSPEHAWSGWWLQPREFARAIIRIEWELCYQRSQERSGTAPLGQHESVPVTESLSDAGGQEERAIQDGIEAYLSIVPDLEWRDTSRLGLSGYPDVQATYRGHPLFFEVKTPAGRVQPQQQRWHENMRLTGATVEVVRSVDDVKIVIARLESEPTESTER